VSAPRKVEDALVTVVHMYQTVGAQNQALLQIAGWARDIAASLEGDGIYQELAQAARAVETEAKSSSDMSGSYRDQVEKLQHALEAFSTKSHK
jgi:hypothetical protein